MAFKITGEPWIKIASSMIGMRYHIFLTFAVGVSDPNGGNLSVSKIINISGQDISEKGPKAYEFTALERIRARMGSPSRTASLSRFR